MKNEDLIRRVVNKLDYKWYLSKKDWFKKETFYDKREKKIYDVLIEDDSYSNEKGNLINKEREVVIDVNFYQYCANSNYPECLSSYEEFLQYEGAKFPIDTNTVVGEIVNIVEGCIRNFTNLEAINKYILLTIDNISNGIRSLLEIGKELDDYDGYNIVLESFYKSVRKEFSQKYGHIKAQIELLEVPDKFEFNLTQEQLAALLLLLNKARFLNTTSFNDTKFLHFCQKYFYFKKKDSFKRPESFETLSAKYREFLNRENFKSLEFIILKLSEVIKAETE